MNPWIPHLLRAGGGGGGAVLPPTGRTMLANLTSSLILDEGTGGPTWSRATKAWGFNELGYLEELASGCAFFGGARLVRNLVPTPSTTLAVAGTKTVTLTQAATLQFSMGAGVGMATFSGTGGASGTLAAGASRVSVNKTVTAGTFIVTASVDALVDLSIVDVANYDASYVPEYVSVGVEASPYFGAGIDGAKYFETDWQGAPISAANLLGFRREAAATNNLLHSRDLTQSAWTPTGTSGSEIITNGAFAADTDWAKTAGWAIGSGQATCTANGSNQAITQASATAYVSGTKYVLSYTVVSNTLNAGTLRVGGYSGSSGFGTSPTTIPSAVGAQYIALTASPTGTGVTLDLWVNGAASGALVIDNVSVKLAAVQPAKTATGLDGIANTATTLTATAADAIILQPISLASAARCASAYVKRRTGTGTISFTQDGGSTWTDITSQINSSTWSRVQITSTLANPSVGFKISTSGDAIDVDCVQNEAGAKATSPIVTTTTTVTRNADSLAYQTASNIDFAVGTIYCEVQSTPTGSNRNAVAPGNSSCNASNSSSTSWRAFDGTTVVEKTGLSDISTGRRKRANSWGPANTKVTGDGLTPASGAFDGLFGDGAILYIAQNFQGYIGPVAIYNYQMTDAELQAITS